MSPSEKRPPRRPAVKSRSRAVAPPPDWPAERLLSVHRAMLRSRRLDEKMLLMLRQMKSFFHIGASGHEAVQLACADALQAGHDYFYPYYRDMALCLGLGMTPRELLLCFLARADDPNSGGRQMPSHFGHRALHVVSQSSPTGTQYLQAVGAALACRRRGGDEAVYVSSGEGTTSQGEFHEALNWAARDRLPVLFVVQDNKYAISVPIAEQTAGGDVLAMVQGYPGLARVPVDGTDFFASAAVAAAAVRRARAGEGPTLIVAETVRLLPHSSSDDQRKYRAVEELAADRARDPIPRFEAALAARGLADAAACDARRAEVRAEIDEDADWAEAQPEPARDSVGRHLFAEADEQPALAYEARPPAGRPIVLVDAINHALDEELARNERLYVFGEDVAGDKGGVFTATRGLTARHGPARVFNTQLAEASIVGVACGMATVGLKPVAEIQFGDYVWPAMMQLRNEVATLRYRSNGAWRCPLVLRVPVGGYIHGGPCHSQSIEGFFAHLPGLLIAFPSNAADAKGLLKTACRLPDPVLFLEHKGLYRQGYAAAPEPDADFLLPFGKARLVQAGADVTVVTWGMMVHKSVAAARALADEGPSVEILDLRTIAPLDFAAVARSVQKTHRVLVAHEDTLTAGFGAELAARLADECFADLDAPVRRVGARDLPVPYHWDLEDEMLPQERDLRAALEELAAY